MNVTEGWAWTEPRVDQLKVWWADGLTSGQIVRKFDGAVTRNAVLGKAYRIGLMRPPGEMAAQTRKGIAAGPPRKRAQRDRRTPFRAPPVDAPPTQAAPPPAASPPDAYRCGLLELTNASCRYVVSGDGPPFVFCGAPEADFPAVSYCRFHARLVYRRPGEREEAA